MGMLLIPTRAGYVYECPECSKRLDPSDIIDSVELSMGHDCEVN